MVALLFAFQEYFSVGEFFAFRDIAHHEAGEVTSLAFGSGVFLAAIGFSLYHKNQTANAIQYQFAIPAPYPTAYNWNTQQWPAQTTPPGRRYYRENYSRKPASQMSIRFTRLMCAQTRTTPEGSPHTLITI
jgi:hypothetical protein